MEHKFNPKLTDVGNVANALYCIANELREINKTIGCMTITIDGDIPLELGGVALSIKEAAETIVDK